MEWKKKTKQNKTKQTNRNNWGVASFSTSCRPGLLSFLRNLKIARMTSTHWSHQHFDLWSFLLNLTAHRLLLAVEWSKQKLEGPGLQVYRLATPMKTHENIVSEHRTMSRETRPSFFPLPPPPKTSYQSYVHTPPDEIWLDSSFTRNRSLTVHMVLTNQVEYQFLSELLPYTHVKSATSANPKRRLSAELPRIHETTPSPPKNVHGYSAHPAQVKFSTVPAKKMNSILAFIYFKARGLNFYTVKTVPS